MLSVNAYDVLGLCITFGGGKILLWQDHHFLISASIPQQLFIFDNLHVYWTASCIVIPWIMDLSRLLPSLLIRHENFQEISWFQEILCPILLIFRMFWDIFVHFYTFSGNALKIHSHAWLMNISITVKCYPLLASGMRSVRKFPDFRKCAPFCRFSGCCEHFCPFSHFQEISWGIILMPVALNINMTHLQGSSIS